MNTRFHLKHVLLRVYYYMGERGLLLQVLLKAFFLQQIKKSEKRLESSFEYCKHFFMQISLSN